MEQLLDFEKAKVQELTLEQLERTHKENDVYGKPLKGIYHFQMVEDVLDMCRELNFNAEVYDLFAAQNKDRQSPGVVILPQVEAQYGKNAVEAHILRRVFTNIRITDFDDGEYTTNLAVAFHQRGIQVGFGNMVTICHNQCMLNADLYAATYNEKGKGRVGSSDIEEVKDIVKSWLTDARHLIVTEREKLERMKNISIGAEETFALIGMLTAVRVRCDSRNDEIRLNKTYPLNQAQISRFTELLLLHYHRTQKLSVYDLYNAATELYKANEMDIPQLLPQNRAMVEFLDERFSLD